MSGWIKLHRSILESEHWPEGRHSPAEAWIDLLMLARWQHEPRKAHMRGCDTVVHRGEVLTTRSQLAERWGWERRTVARWIEKCVRRGDLVIKTPDNHAKKYLLVLVANFGKYQDDAPTGVPTDVPSTCHQPAINPPTGVPTLKEGKKERKKEDPNAADAARVLEKINEVRKVDGMGSLRVPASGLRQRLREGATVADCLLVYEYKRHMWLDDPEWRRHLNSQGTLWKASSWEGMLLSAIEWQESGRPAQRQAGQTQSKSLRVDADAAFARTVGLIGEHHDMDPPYSRSEGERWRFSEDDAEHEAIWAGVQAATIDWRGWCMQRMDDFGVGNRFRAAYTAAMEAHNG